MIQSFMSGIISCFKPKKYYQTFTYYIPAPPSRHSSYREKTFDQLILDLGKKGFVVEDIKPISHQTQNYSGCWIICLISSTDPSLQLDSNFADKISTTDKELNFE